MRARADTSRPTSVDDLISATTASYLGLLLALLLRRKQLIYIFLRGRWLHAAQPHGTTRLKCHRFPIRRFEQKALPHPARTLVNVGCLVGFDGPRDACFASVVAMTYEHLSPTKKTTVGRSCGKCKQNVMALQSLHIASLEGRVAFCATIGFEVVSLCRQDAIECSRRTLGEPSRLCVAVVSTNR